MDADPFLEFMAARLREEDVAISGVLNRAQDRPFTDSERVVADRLLGVNVGRHSIIDELTSGFSHRSEEFRAGLRQALWMQVVAYYDHPDFQMEWRA